MREFGKVINDSLVNLYIFLLLKWHHRPIKCGRHPSINFDRLFEFFCAKITTPFF